MKRTQAHRGKTVTEAEFRRLWSDKSRTLAEIGEVLGISGAAVGYRAVHRGYPDRGFGPAPLISDDAQFASMWAAGVKSAYIARAFGVGERTVRHHAKRLNLPHKVGGKGRGITLSEYRELQLLEQLKASAAETRAQWALAEMVDGAARTGRWAA